MQTSLIEFKNSENELLRGILTKSNNKELAVLMVGGFERSATTEVKFKAIADRLDKINISTFRFDNSGCGLSDGNFSNITIKKVSSEIIKANKQLINKTNCKEIIIIAHSLSTCAIELASKHLQFKKIVLIAPALNQKDLLRYYFVNSQAKEETPNEKIYWSNYKKYLNETKFEEDCKRTDKSTKTHIINADYFLENKNKVYGKNLQGDILHIHGEKDDKVPFESVPNYFTNQLIVKGGNHDLEKPNAIKQWLDPCIKFITS